VRLDTAGAQHVRDQLSSFVSCGLAAAVEKFATARALLFATEHARAK